MQIYDLLTEYLESPLGMDESSPRFSYRIANSSSWQLSRRVKVVDEFGNLVWDSGVVSSGSSIQIAYSGDELKPFTRYAWSVDVITADGSAFKSPTAFFETGFLGSKWTNSKWLRIPAGQGNNRPAARLAKEFSTSGKLRRARLCATALGLYVPFVNGREITPNYFMPGWTQYNKRVQYQVFDITDFIADGINSFAALVGDGWYCGAISYVGVPPGDFGYGRYPLFRAEIRLEYEDGSLEIIGTDRSWSSFYLSPALLSNDIYHGEEYDAMFDDETWKLPGFKTNAKSLNSVDEVDCDVEIDWNAGAPVRIVREIKPVRIEKRPSGVYLLDFGENIAGVDKVFVKGCWPNAVITIRHGEALDEEGNLWRDNLAFARATTTLTCGRTPGLVYSPRFTFFGYRFAEVYGWPEEMTPDSVTALVLSSCNRRTGDFSCSNDLVNRFYANVLRSQQGNFIDVPTDCPQRCERFGWTGDAQVFCETALTNFDTSAFFTKWIKDLDASRNPFSGAFPCLAPEPTARFAAKPAEGSAGWSDAGVVCPWMLYRKFGDRRIIEREFDSVVRYLDHRLSLDHPSTIGDHLNLDAPTSCEMIARALLIEMLRIAVKMACLVDRADVERRFSARRAELLADFGNRYFSRDGELAERTQTAAAFVLHYGLAPSESAYGKARKLLVEDIVANRGCHLSTGFLGTPILLQALTECGELDLAYKLLEQTTFPSWLYPVTQGATTVWERWNGIVDGEFHPNWMNSFNHYAYGSVVSWFYDTVCGIKDLSEENPAAAGWKHFRLAPKPGGSLTHASGSVVTPYGEIKSAWEKTGDRLSWSFTIPANTDAEIIYPGEVVSGFAEPAASSGIYTAIMR